MTSAPDSTGLPGREEILSGALDDMMADVHRHGHMRIIPVATRTAAKRAMLDQIAPGDDLWLFGYGSLLWNPAFRFAERRRGRIYGFHRRFCFWTKSGRGTPARPGLMLALEPGGSCQGAAFRVPRAEADDELQSVFLREMMTGAYRARWVDVHIDRGTVRAITFVANPGHQNYAGRVPFETAAHHIAGAEGRFGACRDYLRDTVHHLEALGIVDRPMRRLLGLVERHAGGNAIGLRP